MGEHFLHQRVAEELRHHPPFSDLEGGALLLLSENIEILYLHSKQLLFSSGEPLHDRIYFVSKGSMELWREDVLIDLVEPGEMLGLRALFEEGVYKAGAHADAKKDVLLYALPIALVQELLVRNPNTEHFFQLDWKGNREDFVPSGTSLRRLMKKESATLNLPISSQEQGLDWVPALCVSTNTSIRELAIQMNNHRADAAIITDQENFPIGILTDRDLRKCIAQPNFELDHLVTSYMSAPVRTFSKNIKYADAMVAMVEHRIHHLVITESGHAQEPVLGIISDHEVLLEQALNPSVIVKQMERAHSFDQLEKALEKAEKLRKNYVNAQVSTRYLMKMMTEFYTGMYARTIQLSIDELGPPPCEFSWLALGSLGRGEQLVKTDQDHALVIEDSNFDAYFEELAKKVSLFIERFGFEEDHFGVTASNALWRGSPVQWQKKLSSWISEGEGNALLQISIVLDARAIYGNINIALPAFNSFYKELENHYGLQLTLATDALRNPSPLNFFKQFKLESSGEFDLKLRALLPFIDAAKVLATAEGKSNITGTIARLEAIKNDSNESLINNAVHAFEILLDLRIKFSEKNGDDGRYINPDSLDQLDKQLLRNVLKTLEALQSHLKLKFKL